MKEYIVVEVNERNFHLCKKVVGSDFKYQSVVNGRSRIMVENFCKKLNGEEEECKK